MLLLRAADRLDELDRGASPLDWNGYSDILNGQPRGEIFCGPRVDGYRTGSVCSWSVDDENSDPMSQADIDLVCALRPVAAPLAAWLRRTVRLAEHYNDAMVPVTQADAVDAWLALHHAPALQIARGVLDETDGDGQ